MMHKNNDNTTLNSIQMMWGVDNQERWNKLRERSIENALEALGKKLDEFINQADADNAVSTVSISLFSTDKEKSLSQVELARKLSQLLQGNSTSILTHKEIEELKNGPLGKWINQCDPKAIPYLFTNADNISTNSPRVFNMMHKNNDNTDLNSLQKSWGINNQKRWNKLREISIQDALELFSKQPNVSFTDLYAFLIGERASIAARLSPNLVKDIQIFRSSDMEEVKIGDEILPTSLFTPIKNESIYVDFYQELYAEFNRYNPVYGEIMAAAPNPTMSIMMQYGDKDKSDFYSLAIKFDDDLKAYNCRTDRHVCIMKGNKYLEINYKGIPYTVLMEITPYTLLNREQLKKLNKNIQPVIMISHCLPSNITKILIEVTSLYDKLQSINNVAVLAKIKIIKEMVWHLSHASTQRRGNAAIIELFFETLLRHHSISYEKIRIPAALIALFSISPEEFDRKFTINAAVETLSKKLDEFINQADAVNMKSNTSLGFFATDKEKSLSQVELAKKLSQLLQGNSTNMLTHNEIEELKNGPLGEWINQCDPKAIPYLFTSVDKVNINSPIIK